MDAPIRIKFCGLKEPRHIAAAVEAGAAYIGFMFFEKSPRNLTISQAGDLAAHAPAGIARVAVTVNAGDDLLDQIAQTVGVDMLQLHGSESPERVAQIKTRYGLPVIKVVGIADETDLPALLDYSRVADQLLVETKAAKGAKLPGGNGVAFDWRLIANRRWPVPWMLAGGLNPDNVAQAIRISGVRQVDVSSGIETAPGIKSSKLINAFAAAAQSV